MIRTLVLISFLIFTLPAAYCQHLDRFNFGVKGGVNLSIQNGFYGDQTRTEKGKNGFVLGLAGGMFAKLRVKRDFFLQAECTYSQQGGTYTQYIFDMQNTASISDTLFTKDRIVYLKAPLLFGEMVRKYFRVYAGPCFNYLLSIKTWKTENGKTTIITDRHDINPIGLNFEAGIGLDAGSFIFDLRYDRNVSRVYKQNDENRTNMVLLSIGYKIK